MTNYVPAQIEKIILTYNGQLVNSFKQDSRYVDRVTYLGYNTKGLPTQIQAKNGSITQMEYGYNDLLIINIRKANGTPDENSVQYEYNPIYGATNLWSN